MRWLLRAWAIRFYRWWHDHHKGESDDMYLQATHRAWLRIQERQSEVLVYDPRLVEFIRSGVRR